MSRLTLGMSAPFPAHIAGLEDVRVTVLLLNTVRLACENAPPQFKPAHAP
jgi:hypothetical protein